MSSRFNYLLNVFSYPKITLAEGELYKPSQLNDTTFMLLVKNDFSDISFEDVISIMNKIEIYTIQDFENSTLYNTACMIHTTGGRLLIGMLLRILLMLEAVKIDPETDNLYFNPTFSLSFAKLKDVLYMLPKLAFKDSNTSLQYSIFNSYNGDIILGIDRRVENAPIQLFLNTPNGILKINRYKLELERIGVYSEKESLITKYTRGGSSEITKIMSFLSSEYGIMNLTRNNINPYDYIPIFVILENSACKTVSFNYIDSTFKPFNPVSDSNGDNWFDCEPGNGCIN